VDPRIFVPVIGGLWYLVECGFLKGTTGPHNYGPDPLGLHLTARAPAGRVPVNCGIAVA
jgi:hypothetical protein